MTERAEDQDFKQAQAHCLTNYFVFWLSAFKLKNIQSFLSLQDHSRVKTKSICRELIRIPTALECNCQFAYSAALLPMGCWVQPLSDVFAYCYNIFKGSGILIKHHRSAEKSWKGLSHSEYF